MHIASRVGTTVRMTALALAAVGMAYGCATQGTTVLGDSPGFEVETSQLFVSATNVAGQPLMNIRIVIIPVGRTAGEFSTSYARMESSERRDFSLSQFRGNDGTSFSLRIHRPDSVRVTGVDLNGNTHGIEVPWN